MRDSGGARSGPDSKLATPQAHDVKFIELFASSGNLTKAMRRSGIPCRDADELEDGGTDFFLSTKAVERLKKELTDLAGQGWKLVVHLAPPCASFSRAAIVLRALKCGTACIQQAFSRSLRTSREPTLLR